MERTGSRSCGDGDGRELVFGWLDETCIDGAERWLDESPLGTVNEGSG